MRLRSVRRPAPAFLALAASLGAAACELTETVLSRPDDLIVVEAVMRAGEMRQHLYLHRTVPRGSPPSRQVEDAVVRVTDEHGNALDFMPTAHPECLADESIERLRDGTCYVNRPGAGLIPLPGMRLALDVRTPDGMRLVGTTGVPGYFDLVRPAASRDSCAILPGTSGEITWTRAEGAWVYTAEIRLEGLREALAPQGIEVPASRLDLGGLAIGAADTTIVFPGEFGIFDRADERLTPVLLAIRDGLPEGIRGRVVVAAADRNYVNWVRGGSFNPSGTVRVPSVAGDGTGMFGSVVPRSFDFVVAADRQDLRRCFGD